MRVSVRMSGSVRRRRIAADQSRPLFARSGSESAREVARAAPSAAPWATSASNAASGLPPLAMMSETFTRTSFCATVEIGSSGGKWCLRRWRPWWRSVREQSRPRRRAARQRRASCERGEIASDEVEFVHERTLAQPGKRAHPPGRGSSLRSVALGRQRERRCRSSASDFSAGSFLWLSRR